MHFEFEDPFAQNWGFGGKMEEGVVRCLPQRTRIYFWGFYVCANFGEVKIYQEMRA